MAHTEISHAMTCHWGTLILPQWLSALLMHLKVFNNRKNTPCRLRTSESGGQTAGTILALSGLGVIEQTEQVAHPLSPPPTPPTALYILIEYNLCLSVLQPISLHSENAPWDESDLWHKEVDLLKGPISATKRSQGWVCDSHVALHQQQNMQL